MSTLPGYLKAQGTGCLVAVKLQPRSSRNELCGELGGMLKIKVTAPPVDSAANELLVEFLSDLLHVAKSSVQIVKGHTSRTKMVLVSGVSPQEFMNRIEVGVK